MEGIWINVLIPGSGEVQRLRFQVPPREGEFLEFRGTGYRITQIVHGNFEVEDYYQVEIRCAEE